MCAVLRCSHERREGCTGGVASALQEPDSSHQPAYRIEGQRGRRAAKLRARVELHTEGEDSRTRIWRVHHNAQRIEQRRCYRGRRVVLGTAKVLITAALATAERSARRPASADETQSGIQPHFLHARSRGRTTPSAVANSAATRDVTPVSSSGAPSQPEPPSSCRASARRGNVSVTLTSISASSPERRSLVAGGEGRQSRRPSPRGRTAAAWLVYATAPRQARGVWRTPLHACEPRDADGERDLVRPQPRVVEVELYTQLLKARVCTCPLSVAAAELLQHWREARIENELVPLWVADWVVQGHVHVD
eukprot:4107818-Prymnesium_polylepis.2